MHSLLFETLSQCFLQSYSWFLYLILHTVVSYSFSLCVDVVQLEQDTMMGMKSLLLLCSQDDSASAQTTLKVSTLLCVHICTLC